jgi:hypothetical protein
MIKPAPLKDELPFRHSPLRFVSAFLLILVCAGTTAHAGPCSFTLSPGSASPLSLGGSSNLTVTASGGTCSWTATTTNSWIHTTSSGTGNGTVNYTVDANNSTSSRSGAITVGNATFAISQAGQPISLGVALNNTNLIWQTSPDYPWYGTNPPAPTYDGVNSAVSGNRYVQNSSSWIQTTVVGPGTVTFWWKVSSDVTPPPPDAPYSFDWLEFDINGEMQDQIMGYIDWNYRIFSVPPGTNVLTWQYVKDPQYNAGSDQAWLDEVTYTTNTSMALQEALNTCGVNWSTGSSSNGPSWTGETAVAHDGKSAGQSGSLYVNQESWLQTSVTAVTNVSFWWKVSSQTNYDFLEFYTNGALARRISGEVNWQSNYFALTSPTNILKWRYLKTNSIVVSQGQNCAWLDQVSFNPKPKAFPYTLLPPAPQPDGSIQLGLSGEAGCNCQIQFSTNLTTWAPLTNLVTTGTNTTFADPSASNSSSRFYRVLSL